MGPDSIPIIEKAGNVLSTYSMDGVCVGGFCHLCLHIFSTESHSPRAPIFFLGRKKYFPREEKKFPSGGALFVLFMIRKIFQFFQLSVFWRWQYEGLYSRNSPPNPVKGAAERMNESQSGFSTAPYTGGPFLLG